MTPQGRTIVGAGCGVAAIAVITVSFRALGITSPAIVALVMLLAVLVTATEATLAAAIAVSLAAMACFNYFFLPPIYTWTISDPQNLVALFVFLVVSLVAGNLSSLARRRAVEARARGDEVTRLFDLTRDILLTGEGPDAKIQIAKFIARRFGFDLVAVCLPSDTGWQQHGSADMPPEPAASLDRIFAGARATLEFDAATRTYSGHEVTKIRHDTERALVPLRLGTRPIGVLITEGPPCEPGTRDAFAGVTAVAVERLAFLEERRQTEVVRRSAELRRALFASMSHDLRTPLTAITVAATNLNAPEVSEDQRAEQAAIVLQQVRRLNRLFQNIVDMARVEADAVVPEPEWGAAADIVEAARRLVEPDLDAGRLRVIDRMGDRFIHLDPRLIASALAHLLENAAQYSPANSMIDVMIDEAESEVRIAVRDRGPGLASEDRARLFDRFFRGAESARHPFGSGLGLAITRGLVAAQRGHVWADNHPEGGAVFTIAVPADVREGVPS
jgi:two-component system sensor histidine kinase KdpD